MLMDTKSISKEVKFHRLKDSIDRGNPIPLYYQLEQKIRGMIEQNILEDGERLPSDMDLSSMLGVNHLTLKKALGLLAKENIVERSPRAGTFIRRKISHNPTIGFFYFAEAEAFMAKWTEYMQRYIAPHGYDLKVVAFNSDFYDRVNLVDEVSRKQLAGAIFVALGSDNCLKQLRELERRNFPHVRMGNKYFCEELEFPLVRSNDRQRIKDALEYLWNMGHRRIGLACAKEKWETDEGYLEFYRNRRFEKRWLMILNFSGPPELYAGFPGANLARGYLESNPDITAVVTDVSPFSRDILTQARCMGKNAPDDLSIMSINESPVSQESRFFTGMKLSPRAEAEKTCEILLKVLQGKWNKEDRLVLVDYDFLEGESVAPARKPVRV